VVTFSHFRYYIHISKAVTSQYFARNSDNMGRIHCIKWLSIV